MFLGITVLAATVAAVFHLGIHLALRPRRIAETGSPAGMRLDYRIVSIPTAHGRNLFGWFIPAPGSLPAPAIAVLHGWGSNAEMMLPVAEHLQRAGYALLLFDARNHGNSGSDVFTSMPRFAEDLDHALDWLASQPEVDPGRLAAIGHSVGAGAVLLSASRRDDLAAAVCVSAFCHPEAMMRRFLAQYRVPYRPIGWYVLRYVQFVIGHRFDAIAPCNTMRAARCPVLLVHGRHDTTVPVEEAEAIFARRADDESALLVLDGNHEGFEAFDLHVAAVVTFVDRAFARRGRSTGAA